LKKIYQKVVLTGNYSILKKASNCASWQVMHILRLFVKIEVGCHATTNLSNNKTSFKMLHRNEIDITWQSVRKMQHTKTMHCDQRAYCQIFYQKARWTTLLRVTLL